VAFFRSPSPPRTNACRPFWKSTRTPPPFSLIPLLLLSSPVKESQFQQIGQFFLNSPVSFPPIVPFAFFPSHQMVPELREALSCAFVIDAFLLTSPSVDKPPNSFTVLLCSAFYQHSTRMVKLPPFTPQPPPLGKGNFVDSFLPS